MRSEIGGAGYWGHNLIRNSWDNEECRLAVVCDKDSVTLSKALRRYPTIEVTQDYSAVLQNVAVDAVVIATPPRRISISRAGPFKPTSMC